MATKVFVEMTCASYSAAARTSDDQRSLTVRPKTTLHYHPGMKYVELLDSRDDVVATTRNSVALATNSRPTNASFHGCSRDLDSVDEDVLTKLCYVFELDKLYDLPDLGKGGEILEKI